LKDIIKCKEHTILSNIDLQKIAKISDDCVQKLSNVRDSTAVNISSILSAETIAREKPIICFKHWRLLMESSSGISLKTIIK